MDMPKPAAEHARLAQFAGDWEGEEKIHPSRFDPNPGAAKSRVSARMALGGFYLISDYAQQRGGGVNFQGHGVFGWDPRGRCYTMHWFDSSGIEHGAPSLGTWEGNALILQHETTHMGFSRYVYEIVRDGEYTMKLQVSQDGKNWQTFLEGRYRRQ